MPMAASRSTFAWNSALQKIRQSDGLGRTRRVLDSSVHVFGVFSEDDHIHFFGVQNGGSCSFKPAHGPDTGIQVEGLTQCHVQTAESPAYGRSQRTLDGDFRSGKCVQCCLWQKFSRKRQSLFPGKQFRPFQFFRSRAGQGRIQNRTNCLPDFRPDAVPFNPEYLFLHVLFSLQIFCISTTQAG